MSRAKVKKFSKGVIVLLCILSLLVGFVGGFFGYYYFTKPDDSDVYVSGDLSFHFLELGNNYTGDSVYINCGETDILVDGGSRTNSSATIKNYLDDYIADGKLEYVIVTHADRDHIASFAGDGSNVSLFDMYEVGCIIDFPKTGKNTDVLQRYYEKRDAEITAGATHYTALQCWNETDGAKRSIELYKGVTLNILYNYYYENSTSDENNYSVCFQIEQGDNKFLFTGDLEEKGEEYLVENNKLSKVKLFKAGHHGSPTSSNDVLLNVIQPEIVVCCCVAGSVEYTQNIMETTFPSQAFLNRVSKWTTQVYVPTVGSIIEVDDGKGGKEFKDNGFSSLNGNIVVTSNKKGVKVECSNNNTLLKDTAWFAEYRDITQTNWQTAA